MVFISIYRYKCDILECKKIGPPSCISTIFFPTQKSSLYLCCLNCTNFDPTHDKNVTTFPFRNFPNVSTTSFSGTQRHDLLALFNVSPVWTFERYKRTGLSTASSGIGSTFLHYAREFAACFKTGSAAGYCSMKRVCFSVGGWRGLQVIT